MNVNIRVVDDDICRRCEHLEPVQSFEEYEAIEGLPYRRLTPILRCKHYNLCEYVFKATAELMKEIDDEEETEDEQSRAR